jgi:membrane protein
MTYREWLIPARDFREIWRKARQDQVPSQATALAYKSILSLVPILAVAFFLFNAFGGFETLSDKIQPFIEENLAPNFSTQISSYLENFMNNAHADAVGIFGVLGFMITAISTLATIELTFNNIWGTSKQRRWGKRLTTYWSLLTLGPFILALSIYLSSEAMTWLRADSGWLSHLLVYSFEIVPYLIISMLFSFLYFFMPNVPVDQRDALRGGFATGAVFEVAKILYASYAAHALAQNKIYGSLVVIPVFLVWLYVVWLIVLFGAELCCYFQYRRLGIPFRFGIEDRLNPFLVVDIIEALGDHQMQPKGGLTAAKLLEILKLPLRQLMRHMDYLQEEGWVVQSAGAFTRSGNRYFLAVPEDQVDIPKIFAQLESRRYIPRSERGQQVHNRFKGLFSEWTSHRHDINH